MTENLVRLPISHGSVTCRYTSLLILNAYTFSHNLYRSVQLYDPPLYIFAWSTTDLRNSKSFSCSVTCQYVMMHLLLHKMFLFIYYFFSVEVHHRAVFHV